MIFVSFTLRASLSASSTSANSSYLRACRPAGTAFEGSVGSYDHGFAPGRADEAQNLARGRRGRIVADRQHHVNGRCIAKQPFAMTKNRRFTRKSPVPDWDQEQTGLVSVRDISATGEGRSPKPSLGLAARQHRNRAAVLRPAGDVVAGRDGPLLSIADGANSCRRNAAGHEIVLGGFGPPRA